ncbi:FtsX-like permease family protein [Streptomyces sp. NPDC002133]|uniref:FtsX-like permease family protein n=1 Tax=Streptomyces sp. NPDC002133 TaxID=3154409 RepID=UPI00331BB159
MTRFVLLRLRAHRLLLTASLLAVLLTTCVLAVLSAFSGAIGNAALQHSLGHRDAVAAALVVSADVPSARRQAAEEAVVRGARQTFDGLPVSVRELERSGPYALPREPRGAAADAEFPDLTEFAALDRSRIELVEGTLPGPVGSAAEPLPVALPEAAAQQLKLRPGARLTLADRVSEKPLEVRVTGLYRAADAADPYWQLDSLGGRGVRTLAFTTYGPLMADPSVLASPRTSQGATAWLATAGFRDLGTERIATLRTAAERGQEALRKDPAFAGSVTVRTGLPGVLAQAERALMVSRSTLVIVAVQLIVLAAYALMLVARLLSSERAGETGLLQARGGSRRRITGLAGVEAALLALPAALCAPLLAGPLSRQLVERSSLGGIGLRFDDATGPAVWLVAGLVAVCCAAAVVAPAVAASAGRRRGRAAALPAPLRAGADVALLAVAAVAYWQLNQQTAHSGTGVLSGDSNGRLGVDPLLVVAPALALLAGTVLVLRLMPPVARFVERRAAAGRTLPSALAAWQFSRRPQRGAGPVLLLVLAVSMGMLAIGQSASWDRSQNDQADFRVGASIRVHDNAVISPGDAGQYASQPGVRVAAPAHRTTLGLSDNRIATVLALDTARAEQHLMLREDLADAKADRLLAATRSHGADASPGLVLPDGTSGITLRLRLQDERRKTAVTRFVPAATVVVEDGYGLVHRLPLGNVAADGAVHVLGLDLDVTGGGGRAAPVGPLTITGLRLDGRVPPGVTGNLRLSVEQVLAEGGDGAARPVAVPNGMRWQGSSTSTSTLYGVAQTPVTLRPSTSAARPLAVAFRIASTVAKDDPYPPAEGTELRLTAERPAPERELAGIASDAFLRAAGARQGQSVNVTLAGEDVRVTIVDTLRQLPTTGPEANAADSAQHGSGRSATGTGPVTENDDGGALLLDLGAVNELFARRASAPLAPTEWWLSTAPGKAAAVADALRERPDADPADVLVRDEVAEELSDDPLGAGPRQALPAVALAAAALAAVGFAVSAVGALRERSAEMALLNALGAPRRRLARMVAAEQGVLIATGLLAGAALGAALTRAVVPLIVLTGRATQPAPDVLVELPLTHVSLLLAGVALLPLLTVAAIALRRAHPALTLRHQGDS